MILSKLDYIEIYNLCWISERADMFTCFILVKFLYLRCNVIRFNSFTLACKCKQGRFFFYKLTYKGTTAQICWYIQRSCYTEATFFDPFWFSLILYNLCIKHISGVNRRLSIRRYKKITLRFLRVLMATRLPIRLKKLYNQSISQSISLYPM